MTWTRGDVARDPADGELVKVVGDAEKGLRRVFYGMVPIYEYPVEILTLGALSYGYAVGDVVLRELDDPAQPFEYVGPVQPEARAVDQEWLRLAACAT